MRDVTKIALEHLVSINPESLGPSTHPAFSFRYIDLTSVDYGAIDWNSARFLRFSNSPSRARRVTQEGDILFSTVRPGLLGHAILESKVDDYVVASTGFAVLRPRSGNDGRFVFRLLFSESVKRQIRAFEVGSNYPAVNERDLARLNVPLLSLAEQRAIADVLDAVDGAIRETETLITKLKRLRLGLIDDLLTRGIDDNGELRPEADLINSRLGRLPAQWLIVALDSLAQQITSGSRGWARYYAPDGALFLRIGNLTREHINLRLDDVVHVAPPTGQEGSRTAVEAGDMLVSITADLGIIGSVPDNFGEAYVNQHIALVRLRQNEVNPRWPAYCLAARQGQARFIRLNDQGAKAGLNLPAVAAISLPSPPRPEQDEIVRKLDDFDIRLHNETLRREKLQCLRDGLRDDLLTGRVRVGVITDAAA